MLADYFETGKIEDNEKKADGDNMSTICLDERLQGGQRNDQEYDSASCREIVTLIKDNVQYEIYSVYHGPDPATWQHSQRRSDITQEADEACVYPGYPVFVEENLLSCHEATMLKDIQYALDNYEALKTEKLTDSNEHINFLEKMKRYYTATYDIIHATAPNDVGTSQRNLEIYLAYFSKAIILPQPFGMENKLLYLESQLSDLDENDSESAFLYVGLVPARSAYMANKLLEAAKCLEARQVRLYCGIAHTNEVLFLLKNPYYIHRYLASPSEKKTQ